MKKICYKIVNLAEQIPAPVVGIALSAAVGVAILAAAWSTNRPLRGLPEGILVGKQNTGERVYEHTIKGHTYLTFGKTIIHAEHCPCKQ